ncbi:DNA-binding XRE family transcriptional regulator [Virgibacillus litoralis]|uniref:DNA-binding XRE family transcriptional regulator n=1 Tax=Virgibacillus litoralis TaxID=578221 RepID=A0ABS4HF41_9BACI|nr:DNA-binding XRE family transcriptional regulator [Virgibacillus litoralis]
MDQETIIDRVSTKVKLIRVEKNYTQDQMATVLGISKKSLVQIEKRRNNANWTTTVALCALFRDSEVIQQTVGYDVLTILETAAHKEN